MYDLSCTSIISFEIGQQCNLMSEHILCPINQRIYKNTELEITEGTIVRIVNEAKTLNFTGCIAFHFYNEPLLYKNKIENVINLEPDSKFLLWTNGLLFNREIEKNNIINKFYKVFITCYNIDDMPFFIELKNYYRNIYILKAEFDDRLEVYKYNNKNILSCKRPLFELPIDYYGNVHLCCYDWNNEIELGNINNISLKEIVSLPMYQNIIQGSQRNRLDKDKYPPICWSCKYPMLEYPKFYKK
jgi:O-glycosyl hydrolase